METMFTPQMLNALVIDNYKKAIKRYGSKIVSFKDGEIVDSDNQTVKLYVQDNWYVFSSTVQTDFNTSYNAYKNGKYIGYTDNPTFGYSRLYSLNEYNLQQVSLKSIQNGNWYIFD